MSYFTFCSVEYLKEHPSSVVKLKWTKNIVRHNWTAVNIQVLMREDDLSGFRASIYISLLEISISVLLGELSSAAFPHQCFSLSGKVFVSRHSDVKDKHPKEILKDNTTVFSCSLEGANGNGSISSVVSLKLCMLLIKRD